MTRSVLAPFLGSLLLFVVCVTTVLATSPGEILANPDQLDGKILSDGQRSVKIFSLGTSRCRDGATATVDGVFQKVKKQGRYTFYDEVEARSLRC